MNTIEELRKFGMVDDYRFSAKQHQIEDMLEKYGKLVDQDFEEGGRWSNFEIYTYEIKTDGETAYFQVVEEVPATELQDGMDLIFQFYEVNPVVVSKTVYERKVAIGEDD
ncbi:hypothetical protein P9695_14880 [Weizmannia sp. CD-2023]|uniref:hypothetical protein n=1 Tax=Heyndrickxia TaxID=2837504 RepID=UPI002E1BC9CE|nr:hypothetical protein [Weizmannia sp. CD-2023]MED4899782.1 hypothetical protein [Weizmannia sp. CD-2023]